tara:strand:+ start:18307 stop:19737 length:1431 start_codon:yes stop_codon:yes gene_type:complete
MSLLGRTEVANYKETDFELFDGNPLIEALPEMMNQSDVLEALSYFPPLPGEFRFIGPDMKREQRLQYIELLRQPLEIYYDVFRAIEMAIKKGYSSRNPFSPTTQHYLHYQVDEPPPFYPSTGKFVGRGRGITLIGESGTGKTSMLEQVLLHFPQVIQHHKYQEQLLGFQNQIVWVKVECPEKSSVRELCEEILLSLDVAIGGPYTKPASNHSALLIQIEQRIKSSHLGILVIDEMNNLSVERVRGESGLLKFMKKIVNRLGVPVLFCANPPFDDILVSLPQNARRSENGGAFFMNRLDRDSLGWKAFVSQLWQLQWTNIETPLTESLEKKLYELCVGNVDFACRTYAEAQGLVIGTGDETICESVLQDAYERACVLSSRASDVLSAKEQLLKSHRQKTSIKNDGKLKEKRPFIPTVDRIQHQEFYDLIRDVVASKSMLENINDPEYVRSSVLTDDPIVTLKERALLCTDPLAEEFC